jgi:hypothetical protein
MKDRWPGINAADSDVASEDAMDAEGVLFKVERQLGRRPGLTKYSPAGGISAAFLRASAGGDFLTLCKSNGDLSVINLLTPGTATTIYSGYNVGVTPTMASINGRTYITNGWDRVLVWNGVDSTFREAGIVAPAAAPGSPTDTAGNVTAGVHLIRYRYLDNTSPASSYRSNASPALEYTVATASAGSLVFDIATSSADIIRSDDAKVTTIQLEATLQGGSLYFVVGTVNNAATAITYNLADAVLALQARAAIYDSGNAVNTDDFGTGNERPPLGTIIAQVRDVTFIGGDTPRTITATFTNGSASISGTGFSANWGNQFVIRGGTDAKTYQIASSTTTTITLVNVYTGSSGSKSAVVSAQNPNRIYWSAYISEAGAAMPESWRLLGRARDVLNATGDKLKGITELNGDVLIAGEFSLQRLIFVDDVTLGELDVVSGQFGVYNQRCFVSVEGQVFGLGPNGAWTCRGGAPEWLSRGIDPVFAALVDESQSGEYHGCYDPVTKSVRWFYTTTGATRPLATIAIDLPGLRWTRETFLSGIDASLYGADTGGHLRSFLMDATGGFTYTYEGATDGDSSQAGAYVATTGSTTTITQILSPALPTGTSLLDLSGVMLTRPSTDETVRITSNTASAITHAAFATAVAAGETLYVGAIPWEWSTGWWIGEGMEEAKRPCMFIEVQPGVVSGTGTVQIYKDWETTPVTWTKTAGVQGPKGVSWNDGEDFVTIEFSLATATDGLLKLPMQMDDCRALRAVLTIATPAGTLRLLDFYFALQSRQDSKTKVMQQ